MNNLSTQTPQVMDNIENAAFQNPNKAATKTHVLNTWPDYFSKVWSREKTFELRKNDRNFQVGDKVILREYFITEGSYSSRVILASISYILENNDFGIKKGCCIFQLSKINNILNWRDWPLDTVAP